MQAYCDALYVKTSTASGALAGALQAESQFRNSPMT